jgi:integrase
MRRRPAIEAAGIRKPARIYDLRSTFATEALAAGVGIHALARIVGTSVEMIERPLRDAARWCAGVDREPPRCT